MGERLLLTNVNVLSCAGDGSEHPAPADVAISNGIIEAVGAPGSLGVDANTRVVDFGGATVMPGLGDAHTHISWPLDFVFDHAGVAADPAAIHAHDVAAVCRTFVEHGYTTIVGAGVLQPDDDLAARDAIERGLIAGPRIIASGPMIAAPGGLGGDGGLMDVAGDAATMREVVQRQCEAGVKALKLFISGDSVVDEFPSEDVYMNDEVVSAAVAEADRHGAFVTAHARGSESVAVAARSGVRIIHHACFLDDEALEAVTDRDDVWVCPGLHYLWAVVEGHAAPWGFSIERAVECGYRAELEASIVGLRQLVAAGVPILAGGDFGHQWTKHGTYAAELQRYVELVGMTPTAAIHTATRNLGAAIGEPVGMVVAGYRADLFVIDGDPSTDITVLLNDDLRRAVIQNGNIVWVNPTRYP